MQSSVPPPGVAAQAEARVVDSGSASLTTGADDASIGERLVSWDGCKGSDKGAAGYSYSAVRAAATLQEEGGAGAAVLDRQQHGAERATGVAVPQAGVTAVVGGGGVDGRLIAGGDVDGGGYIGGVGEGAPASGACLRADGGGLPAEAEGESRTPRRPHGDNDGGPHPPPSSIPASTAVGKPVLAEWMKDEGLDDSDADTAGSLLGGTPSSKNSSSSAAEAAAAQAAAGDTSSLTPALRAVLGSQQDPAATATGTGNTASVMASTAGNGCVAVEGGAARETVGGDRNGKANGGEGATGAGTTRWKLADWIKQGGVDDSDADTNASGMSPRSTKSPVASDDQTGKRGYGGYQITATAAASAAAATTIGSRPPIASASGTAPSQRRRSPLWEEGSVGVAQASASAGGDDSTSPRHTESEHEDDGGAAAGDAGAGAPESDALARDSEEDGTKGGGVTSVRTPEVEAGSVDTAVVEEEEE
ncbi:unnamed protein product, partial [Scytosiphon promiscuus]